MIARRRSTMTPILIALTTCIGDGGSGRQVTAADSLSLNTAQDSPDGSLGADVTVISHPEGAIDAAPTFVVAAQPDVVFGAGESPPIDMQGVRSVRALSDGRIAALDRYLPAIYVFGASGRLLTALGRAGDGPGEFRTVHALAVLPGDSLAVLDQNAARLTVFGLDGGARTAQMPPALSTRFSRLIGCLPSGELVLSSVPTIRAPAEGEHERLPLELAILDFSSEPREILALPDFEVASQLTRFGGRPRMSSTWVRLAARASVRVIDSLIAVTTGDEFVVRLHELTGRQLLEIRVASPPRRVTEAMRDAQIARDLDVLQNVMREPPVHIEESERIIREAPYAEWLPAIGELVESTDGLLWVLEGSAPTDTVWSALAFELGGVLVRRVQGPADLRPVLFRVGNVVVQTTDSDGLVGLESRAYRALR